MEEVGGVKGHFCFYRKACCWAKPFFREKVQTINCSIFVCNLKAAHSIRVFLCPKFQDSGSRSRIHEPLEIPDTFSGGPQGQSYSHNNTKILFAIFGF